MGKLLHGKITEAMVHEAEIPSNDKTESMAEEISWQLLTLVSTRKKKTKDKIENPK